MLKLIIPAIIFMLVTKTTFAQKDTIGLHVPFTNGVVVYERVFNVPGKTKADLFNKGHLWLVARYKAFDAIQILDDSAGTIVGKGREIIRYSGGLTAGDASNRIDISVQMDFKDGRYRCRIFNVRIKSSVADTTGATSELATPEELMNYLIGNKSNPISFNKAQSKRVLQSLNNTINSVMLAINQSIGQQDDF